MARVAMLNLTLRVTGDVERKLAMLDTALSPVGLAAWLGVTVTPYLRQRIAARFAAEGDDVSGGWLPLAEATREIRSAAGFGAAGPINRRTGELENYLTSTPDLLTIDGLGATLTYPGRGASGELADKMRTAQEGGAYKGGVKGSNAPARPVLGMNERDTIFALEALAVYIKEAVRV